MTMRNAFAVLCGVLLTGLVACKGPLDVQNQNQSDVDRTLATPADLETFIGTTYLIAHQATLGGSNDGLQTQMQTMGFENVSGLANFAMGPRGAIPRPAITNTPNATGDAGNQFDFYRGHRAARMATMGLAALKIPRLGTSALGSVGRDRRARAFAHFSLGVALGNLALAYDSASILTEFDDFKAAIPFSGYRAVMTEALKHLDSALALVRVDTLTLPTTWISVPSSITLDTLFFSRLIRSYRARFRADVARTPAERADTSAGGIVNWAQVIADANTGITADLSINMTATLGNSGWDVVWPAQAFATGSANWHQMSQFILGMADTSGAYSLWLGTTRLSRVPFPVVTRDNRFPGSASACNIAAPVPDACRTALTSVGASDKFTGRPYWRNRPAGEDQPVDPFGMSMYDYRRSRGFFDANRSGSYPVMTATEIRLLAAEGYYRTGNYTEMINRINVSRKAAGLDSIPNVIADTLTPVPGGVVGCIPKVPDSAQNFRAAHCGNVWDALKYEYRMETAYAGYGMWFFAGRGWGDIPEGTALNWPVPWEELFVRSMSIYGTGGLGGFESAGRGSYGLFDGGVYGW